MRTTKWDRNKIRKAIQSQYRRGWDISYCAMARRKQSLVSAANYHFGSYRCAVEMAGIDYDRLRKKPQWTRERVITLIRRAHRNRQDLSWRAVIQRGDELARAAMAAVHPQLFSRWNDALVAAGINPADVARYQRWTADRVLKELKARNAAGLPVNSGHVQIELPGMYGAAVRQFGSYDNALAAAGISPDAVKQRRQWTRRQVIDELIAFQKRHGTLSHTVLRRIDSGLLRAVYKFFGSIAAARRQVQAKLQLTASTSRRRPSSRKERYEPSLFERKSTSSRRRALVVT